MDIQQKKGGKSESAREWRIVLYKTDQQLTQ